MPVIMNSADTCHEHGGTSEPVSVAAIQVAAIGTQVDVAAARAVAADVRHIG